MPRVVAFRFLAILVVALPFAASPAQDVAKKRTRSLDDHASELIDMVVRTKKAMERNDSVTIKEIMGERKAYAKCLVGATVRAELTYRGNQFRTTTVNGKRVMAPRMLYGLPLVVRDAFGNNASLLASLSDASEKKILAAIYREARPKDRYTIDGVIVRSTSGGSGFTVEIDVKEFRKVGDSPTK